MRTSFDRVDVVHVREHVFVVGGIVGHGYFYRNALPFGGDMDDIFDEVFLVRVDVLYELFQTLFRVECFRMEFAGFVLFAFVGQNQGNAGIQITEVAQTVGEDLIVVHGGFGEDRGIGFERDRRTRLLCFSDYLHVVQRFPIGKFLHVDFSVSADFGTQIVRERIHTRYADTVQTAGYFVRAFVEFTAGMQYGENNLQCRLVFFFVHIDRNTATVIHYRNRVVFVDIYFDVRSVSG